VPASTSIGVYPARRNHALKLLRRTADAHSVRNVRKTSRGLEAFIEQLIQAVRDSAEDSQDRMILPPPSQFSDGLELSHTECAAFVARFRSRGCESGDKRLPFRLVNFHGVEILIKEHEKDAIPFFRDINRPEALTGLAAGKQTTSLDLQPSRRPVMLFSRVVSSLARCRQLKAKSAGGFVFGNLAGDAQGLARQGTVLLRKRFGVTQDIHDGGVLCHVLTPR
jgi:hypothetical protein